jgi:membrane protein DedA with SNARE-associated domain
MGVVAALGLLFPMEAGVPIPIPSDLLMLFIGQRAGAGDLSIWVAAVALEAVTLAGTTALFLLIRGPARQLLRRVGPKLGLTEQRLGRATDVLQRRGRNALVIGRTTPGLRTITVATAAASGMPAARALPPLLVGSSIFIQGHLILGFVLGSLAEDVLTRARGPFLIGLVVLAAAGVVVWIARRGRRSAAQAWTEASCPACLTVAALYGRGASRTTA